MELQVTEADGSYWTADLADGLDNDKIAHNLHNVDVDTRFIIFEGADGGTIFVNLHFVKNFQVVKKEIHV
jgi:hypothetical protein